MTSLQERKLTALFQEVCALSLLLAPDYFSDFIPEMKRAGKEADGRRVDGGSRMICCRNSRTACLREPGLEVSGRAHGYSLTTHRAMPKKLAWFDRPGMKGVVHVHTDVKQESGQSTRIPLVQGGFFLVD
jgi:hypothetical protein